MQGVEILNTIHSYASLINPFWTLGLCGVGLLISVIGICTTRFDIVQNILFSLIAVVGIGIVVCLIGASAKTDKVIDTRYEVTISDDVSMTEFYKQYEVIEQNGQIFTVREID